jgi:hypothetical protein
METIDGYKRTALALRDLNPQEREWFLDQLEEEDRSRVVELLRDMQGAGDTVAPAPPPRVPAVATNETDYAAVIQAASVETLHAAMAAQPDWVIALVLVQCGQGTALRECVDQLLPPRGDRVRALAERLRDTVKPSVRLALVRVVAGRIGRYDQPQIDAASFESLLMRGNASRTDSNMTPRR